MECGSVFRVVDFCLLGNGCCNVNLNSCKVLWKIKSFTFCVLLYVVLPIKKRVYSLNGSTTWNLNSMDVNNPLAISNTMGRNLSQRVANISKNSHVRIKKIQLDTQLDPAEYYTDTDIDNIWVQFSVEFNILKNYLIKNQHFFTWAPVWYYGIGCQCWWSSEWCVPLPGDRWLGTFKLTIFYSCILPF